MRYLLILCLGVLPLFVSAQKEKKVCAEYVYMAPGNLSLDEAKKIALDRARLKAIADEFGTLVAQNNATLVKNENGDSDIRFSSFGWSEVKGEWLGDVGEPRFEIAFENGMMTVKVSVCGRAREIVREKIEIIARVLRNGMEARNESSEFKNGDDLYLLFQTPRKGYVAVYLVDHEQNVYCLLPYRHDPQGVVSVVPNREYIFFSKKQTSGLPASVVDEYTLTSGSAEEINLVYILYSPNEFTKANDREAEEEVLPRALTFENFQKWKTRNMQRDAGMQVVEKQIRIRK